MNQLTVEEYQALSSLHGYRYVRYEVLVLDRFGVDTGKKLDIISGNAESVIECNDEYEVKKFGRVSVYNYDDIDILTEMIQVNMIVNEEHVWNLGVFMPIKRRGNVIEFADETVRLQQRRPFQKKVFKAGTLYTDALKWFIIDGASTVNIDIQASDAVLAVDIVIDETKNYVQWFNYVADQINYVQLFVDANRYYKSYKYKEPSFAMIGYTYDDGEYTVITDVSEVEADIWSVPNKFKRVVSRGDRSPLVSTYINKNPSSKYSIVRRGIEIDDVETIEGIATQEELDLFVSRLALQAQQIEEVIIINTLAMPHHTIYDIIGLRNEAYVERSWSIELSINGTMEHTLSRVVYDFEML